MDRRRRTHNWTLVLRRFDRHLVDAQRVVAAVIAVQTVGAATWWQTLGIDQKARPSVRAPTVHVRIDGRSFRNSADG